MSAPDRPSFEALQGAARVIAIAQMRIAREKSEREQLTEMPQAA